MLAVAYSDYRTPYYRCTGENPTVASRVEVGAGRSEGRKPDENLVSNILRQRRRTRKTKNRHIDTVGFPFHGTGHNNRNHQ
jgi:hypothetical protein